MIIAISDIEQEDHIRKMKYGKERKTLSDYKKRVSKILPMIKEKIDESKTQWCVMRIEDLVDLLGYNYDIYSGRTIYKNIKIVMEDFNIVVGTKGRDGKGKWTCEFISFRHRDKYDRYIWEKQGFENREEYEDCRKEDRKCNKIKRIARDCREKDPESLFNNKKLIKDIFKVCPIEDGENESDS